MILEFLVVLTEKTSKTCLLWT